MAITLKSLLNIAPFPPEQKKVLLENMDNLTEEEKLNLSKAAWEALSIIYFGKLKVGLQKIHEEVIYEKRKQNPNDYQELEAKLIHEFAQKLELAESSESILEVRKKLEEFKSKPLTQDKSIPA